MSARHSAHVARIDARTLALMTWQAEWTASARPKQLAPAGDWIYWNILAGRGFGKTRIGAEHSGLFAARNPQVRWAVVGPTQDDTRSVCFEGESGLIARIPKRFVSRYNSQKLELWLDNGSLLAGKSAEKPDRLRGPQWHGAWCDETASWMRLQATWDNLMFGMRLGERPRTLSTTTPRPIDFLRKLVKDPRAVTTKGSTFENEANLAGSALEMFKEVYGGTRKGRQELFAEILENSESALFKWAQLEKLRVSELPSGVELVRIVLAVDPAVTTEEDSDETGIVVCGLGSDGHVYVLEDLSGKYSPHEWAKLVLRVYARTQADAIVAETNQGGDLVLANLSAHADGEIFNFKNVHAKRGKYLRAEPVGAYYERGKVHHVGHFPDLERQMCNFTGSTTEKSPDRLDALVYGVGELMLGTVKHDFW